LKDVKTLLMDSRASLLKLAGETIFFRFSASGKTAASLATSGLTLATLALLAVA
jgi:hypothetical protein